MEANTTTTTTTATTTKDSITEIRAICRRACWPVISERTLSMMSASKLKRILDAARVVTAAHPRALPHHVCCLSEALEVAPYLVVERSDWTPPQAPPESLGAELFPRIGDVELNGHPVHPNTAKLVDFLIDRSPCLTEAVYEMFGVSSSTKHLRECVDEARAAGYEIAKRKPGSQAVMIWTIKVPFDDTATLWHDVCCDQPRAGHAPSGQLRVG